MSQRNYMQYVIDWTLGQEAFKQRVRDLIYQARKDGNVITREPFPYEVGGN